MDKLGLAKWIVQQTVKLELKTPTSIQQHCIPEILQGKNCIGIAKTGSGKTFAFALPILHHLSKDPLSHYALILAPTHELAYQISEQFLLMGQPMGVRVCVVSGGSDQMIESMKLKDRPHIVVAVPGRLADHLTGCDTFSFKNLKFLIIDEADRLLNGSFDESLETIVNALPKQRQTLLFSATKSECVTKQTLLSLEPDTLFEWSDSDLEEMATVATLDQKYVLCAEYDRDQVLVEVLRNYLEKNPENSVIIFTNTKKCCQILSTTLNSLGFENICLHGSMKQRERVASLSKFKSKYIKILIATDVASRGLDIEAVQLVINHRLPKLPNEYIHRVGRTARAGRFGTAISIFRFPRDLVFLSEIEKAINTKLQQLEVDEKMVGKIFLEVSASKSEAEVLLENSDVSERQENYQRKKCIEQGLDPDEFVANLRKRYKKRRQQEKQLKRL